MGKRFSMVLLTLLIAISYILIIAKYPTGAKTATYGEPIALLLTIGVVIAAFIPLIVLLLFKHIIVKVIATLYQVVVFIIFISGMIVGFFAEQGAVWIMVCGMVGAFMTAISIIVTLLPEKSE